MKVVIQCAGSKQPDAKFWMCNGKKVLFVADPASAVTVAPADTEVIYAKPDGLDTDGDSWRKKLIEYNENPGENLQGLLPAWQLYRNGVYQLLYEKFGAKNLYILSAGWGLIAADFLTPVYDITFSSGAEDYKLRRKNAPYADLCMLPKDEDMEENEQIVFLGGKSYVDLFCRLTAGLKVTRTVFYNSDTPPAAPDCTLKRFETPARTNWHYQCAKELAAEIPA